VIVPGLAPGTTFLACRAGRSFRAQAEGFSKFSVYAMRLPWNAFSRNPAECASRGDRLARLEMRVKYDFGHGQSAARLQGIEDLAQRSFPIGNFAEHRDEQRAVKPIAREFALPHGGFEKSHILDAAMACREGAGHTAPLKLKNYFGGFPHLLEPKSERRVSDNLPSR
jgi:hypothetical protein